jgi:hypothetical protein
VRPHLEGVGRIPSAARMLMLGDGDAIFPSIAARSEEPGGHQ